MELTLKEKEHLEAFKSLKTKREVAQLLGVQYSRLIYLTRVLSPDKKYINFSIKKKDGGVRTISAPVAGLKYIQKRLNWLLQNFINPKVCAHGFLYERSIKTNSTIHCRRTLVFNIDLKDFFPSIHFGRVRGMFQSPPFNFKDEVAIILAQICCQDILPQGAPTSPIVSNFICSKLDGEIVSLCKKHRCFYTRYADDMTFSTNFDELPEDIINIRRDGKVSVGKTLNSIIEENGFSVNVEKVRLQTENESQIVTGLVVNQFPNVRRSFIRETRAMLHAWHKFGLEAAQSEFYKLYNLKHRNPEHGLAKYQNVVAGRIEFIGMVKGVDDIVYQKLCRKLTKLYPENGIKVKYDRNKFPLIVTEGGSDRMHLKAALRNLQKARLYHYLDIEISDYRESMGEQELLAMCRLKAREPQERRLIFIFDSDNPNIVRDVHDKYGRPRYWGNNVYSFSLPVPSHRVDSKVSIELYYKDEEIKRLDTNGRRLYLSSEFDTDRKHFQDNLTYNKKLNRGLCVLDDDVKDVFGTNRALSKSNFAKNVLEEIQNFDDFDFTEFKLVFNLVESIIRERIE